MAAEGSRTLEEETFEALVHQNRRDILRFVGEKKNPTFTEILNAAKISDSPSLAYHLRSLSQFIKQEKGRYSLTSMGKDAYSLLLRTTANNSIDLVKKRAHRITLGNAVIWGAVVLAAAFLGANSVLTISIIPCAAFISLVRTYWLVDET